MEEIRTFENSEFGELEVLVIEGKTIFPRQRVQRNSDSVGRYDKQIEASRVMGIEIPRQIYIDSGEVRLPIYR